MDERTTDTILSDMKAVVSSGKPIERKYWLDAAFMLMILRIDEAQKFNRMFREVSAEKYKIIKEQEKTNVAAAEIEVQAGEKYEKMKNQEAKLYSVDEITRVAKKNSEEF